MALKTKRVTVTAVATNLIAEPNQAGITVALINRDLTNAIDLGPATVVSGQGFRLKPDEERSIDNLADGDLYGIAAAAQSAVVDVLLVGV